MIIKIDAHGVEPLIFEGMQNIIEYRRPPIIFQFVPWVCKSIMDPVQFLNSFPEGYIFFDTDDSRYGLYKIERSDFTNFIKEISITKSQYTAILMPHEKATGIVPLDNLINGINLERYLVGQRKVIDFYRIMPLTMSLTSI